MIKQASSFAEIVLRIVPSRLSTTERESFERQNSSSDSPKRSYDVLIYTELAIAELPRSTSPPSGQRQTIAGLPFVGRERITVHWTSYQSYYAAFVEGEKAFRHMRERLLETMSPGLSAIFGNPPQTNKPLRLWLSSETPELDDLPWELIASDRRNFDSATFSLVRGLPPEIPTPIVPVGERLRLALIHQPIFTPSYLRYPFNLVPPEIEITEFTESPRKALEQVVREGYELVHIVADGVVSRAYEGILYFHGFHSENSSQSYSYQQQPDSPQLSPNELSTLLGNSRVSVLCLTEQDYSNPDLVEIAGREVPSVYRAFAYLGGSPLLLPSIVAPLGPLKEEQGRRFWSEFYRQLTETFNLSQAVKHAREMPNHSSLPVALFLRHLQNVLFRRETAEKRQSEVDPVHLGASLQLSNELVTQLKAHADLYGDSSEGISLFLENEEKRQAVMSEQLEPWLKSEEETL
ncbi:MAG TPA: CHAT domain-containing protein [Pyrinomonadaceae bacterium]|nr:CHAT domain-containing protein [Pyrinomonadaceae bacterium]